MQHLSEGTLLQGGKFKIEKILGQGGFGITYLASQTISVEGSIGEIKTEIKLAIKEFFMKDVCNRNEDSNIVSVPSVGSKELVERFKQKFIMEARSISKLKHPHIVKVVDVFEENGTAYYVMEYYNGGSLGDLVKDGNLLSESDAVRYITQIADAVGYIHKQKVNHLDIKPGNILLDGKANGILIGFGLSKQYDEKGSQTSFTPVGISHGYAPMEQYKQNGVSAFSPQSDIYALGATLYKLVTGATPPQAMDILDEGLPALPQNISPRVRNAVAQAMQPRKSDRPATAEEFIALLGASGAAADVTILDVVPEPEKPEPKKPEPKKSEPEKPEPQKSNPWKWIAAAVAVVVILGVSAMLLNAEKSIAVIENNGKYGLIDENSVAITPLKYDYLDYSDSLGIAIALLNHKWGFIDKNGQEIVALKYDNVNEFSEGRACVYLNGRWGYVDESGNEITPLKYDYADGFSEGLAIVRLNWKYGFIDKSGNEVIPLKYDDADGFSEGLACVKLNGKYGFIDKSGNEVIPLKYDLPNSFKEGLAKVKLNDKYGFIDKSGNVVIPLKYDYIGKFSEGLAIVRLNWKCGFIDKSGNVVIPLKYDYADGFSEGLARVKLNGKYGFIDKSGNVVIPLKYDFANDFSNARAWVYLNGEEFCIDKKGNRVD